VKTFVDLEIEGQALSSTVLETEMSELSMLRPRLCSLSPLRKIPNIYCTVNPLEFGGCGKEKNIFV
jgi:hypothetical protein